jgi:nitroreductase
MKENETLVSIYKRHSVRIFTEQPVMMEDILTLLQAANQAPSAHNQQSWRFIIIKNEKKRQLVELVSSKASQFPKASGVLLRMAARSIACAPVVVAIANTGDLIDHGTKLFAIEKESAYDFFRTMEIQSSAAAVENLLIAATSLGISSVWLGILFLIKDEVLNFLGEPKGEFMAVIPLGYAEKENKGPNKKSLDNFVKWLD